MFGSGLSIIFLAPTLRDSSAGSARHEPPVDGDRVRLRHDVFTLGMSFSAMGAFAAGSMWSLIALFRSPQGVSMKLLARENLALFISDLQYWIDRRRSDRSTADQYVSFDHGHKQQY